MELLQSAQQATAEAEQERAVTREDIKDLEGKIDAEEVKLLHVAHSVMTT